MSGTVAPIQHLALQPRASESLMMDLRAPVVSKEDLYGGKLLAAMDRPHPRDLFDVTSLLQNEA